MNREYDLEHEIVSVLAERAPMRPPEHLLPSVISSARRKRQLPRWYALLKEPTMHSDSRLAVGSPTARVAAIMAATLLLAILVAGAGVAGARLLASDGTIVVAQDGSGTVTTITEAVALAEDGDKILVRPGTYAEAVIIEQDVSLIGDGPVAEIIVEAPADGPTAPTGELHGPRPEAPYALLLRDVEAAVSGLTFRGEQSQVHARGGSPILEGLVFIGVGRPYTGAAYVNGGAAFSSGTTATLRDSIFESGNGTISYDASEPLVTGNILTDGANIGGHYGDGAVIRGNEISGGLSDGISTTQPTTALIEDNVIADTPVGIAVGTGGSSYKGVDPVVRANSISGARTGIRVGSGAAPIIEGNSLVANDMGIVIGRGASPTLTENRICDNGTNLVVDEDADPTMERNDICPDPPVVKED